MIIKKRRENVYGAQQWKIFSIKIYVRLKIILEENKSKNLGNV